MKKILLSICTIVGLTATLHGAAMAADYSAEYGTPVIDGEKEAAWDLAEYDKLQEIHAI